MPRHKARPQSKAIRDIALVFSWMITGLLLLSGRFDWSAEGSLYSWRSYLASAYYFIFLIPTLFFGLKRGLNNSSTAGYITAAISLIFCFPYDWVGLAPYYFYRTHPLFFDWNKGGLPLPETNWFPHAFLALPVIPGEALLFGSLFALGLGGITLYFRRRQPKAKRAWLITMGLFSVIVLQTWLHLSLRSPYTYIPHYERSESSHYWYHSYLFSNGQGAVNMDYAVFRYAEDLFMGTPQLLGPLLGRTFPMYLSSQFTLFFNAYYVWIMLNITIWFAGVGALYWLAHKILGKPAALFSAVLFASSQGIMVYVAQPKVYAFAISSISILLAIYVYLFETKKAVIENGLLFGVIFGFFLLCYDAQPWIVTILAISYVRKYDFRSSVLGVVVGLAVYLGFIILGHQLPYLTDRPALMGPDPVSSVMSLLLSFDLLKIAGKVMHAVLGFGGAMDHAFLFCLIPAVGGVFLVRGAARLFLLSLVIPAVITYFLMDLADSFYIFFPRLVYSAYPAVYILGGVGLAGLSAKLRPHSMPFLGGLIAWSFLAIHTVYANLDVWGLPQIYNFWFYR
jgi:hypothetical protein